MSVFILFNSFWGVDRTLGSSAYAVCPVLIMIMIMMAMNLACVIHTIIIELIKKVWYYASAVKVGHFEWIPM